MYKILTFFIASILFVSCYHVNTDEIVVPERLLTDKEMTDIITQVQIAEVGFKIVRQQRPNLDELKQEMYNSILTEYNISLVELKANMDYYYHRPEEMEMIYENVLANLSKIQGEVKIQLQEEKIRDSINALNDTLVEQNKIKAGVLKDTAKISR